MLKKWNSPLPSSTLNLQRSFYYVDYRSCVSEDVTKNLYESSVFTFSENDNNVLCRSSINIRHSTFQ